MRSFSGVLFSAAFLVAAAARAQQSPAFTETVVITATGEEQDPAEVAAATTVIGREQIDASGEATVADLLRRVTGATLLRSGLDGGVASLFVRGTSSAHTLVLFDGVRLSSPYFGGYDWSLPLTAGVGRIEVVRGPYSALYGGDAIGGVVNILPDSGRSPGADLLIEGGSDGWRRAEATAGARIGRLDAMIVAASRKGSGALDNDDFTGRSALLDLSYALAADAGIGLVGRWSDGDTEVPFSGATATPNRSTAGEETLIAVPLHVALAGGRLEATLDHVERRLSYRDPDDPWGYVASDTGADSDGARAAYHRTWSAHRVTVGGEWRRDEVTDVSSYGISLDDVGFTTRSLFVQDAVAFGKSFRVLAGVRWDEAPAWGDEVSPRLVASWHGTATRAWVSHGLAFRAPSLGELYYPMSGNPALAPERSHSFEVGASLPLDAAGARLDLAAFRNRVEDLIDFDYASFRFANVERAAQDGVEATAGAPLGGGSWLSLSLTWLDARDGEGLPLLRRAEWSGAATLAGPLFAGVTGELAALWVGARDDLDPVTYARVEQAGFVTVDAAVAIPVTPWLSVRLRADNLADRTYEEVRGYPAPGRRVFLGAAVAAR